MRIGVIGCGQVSPHHFLAWQRCRNAEVVAASDPSIDRARQRAADFGFENVYASAEEMLDREKLDAVDVITPRETHADIVRLAATHGLPVLCEKPLCPTLDEAERLLAELGGAVRVMVNENWRYRPYYTKIGEWIRAGRLGRVIHCRIALKRANLLPDREGVVPALARQPFMAKEHRLLVAESLIHDLDVARSLMGDMTVIAARIGRACPAIIGEDIATVLLETAGGVTTVVEGVLTAAGFHIRAGNRIEICGTRCSVILENGLLRLIGAESEEHVYSEEEMRQVCFDLAVQHFVDCLASGAPFWTSAEDQLSTLRIVEDTYRLSGPIRLHV